MNRDVHTQSDADRWTAHLSLRFQRDSGGTRLAERYSLGPLRVLKILYPEGDEVAHAVVLHPPGGLTSCDTLNVEVALDQCAHAVMTTPGAQKWYRWNQVPSQSASSAVRLNVAAGAVLEWMPQETLLFNGAVGEQTLSLDVKSGGAAFAWEILQLGRTDQGERFVSGHFRQTVEIFLDDALIWSECASILGDSPLLYHLGGFGGRSVCGTLWIVTPSLEGVPELLARIRQLGELSAVWGATSPQAPLICVKALSNDAEAMRSLFQACWHLSRPIIAGRAAKMPRLWST